MKRPWIWSVPMLGVFIAAIVWYSHREVQQWDAMGPMQLFAVNGRVWMFIQIDRWAQSPSSIASPSRSVVGHAQWLVIVDDNHVRQRIPIQDAHSPTFDPNNTAIFHMNDTFHLLTYKSKGDSAFYAWDMNRFRPLSDDDSNQILKQLEIPVGSIPTDEVIIPGNQRSKRLAALLPLAPLPLKVSWGDRTLEVFEESAADKTELSIRCTTNGEAWSDKLVEFESRSEAVRSR